MTAGSSDLGAVRPADAASAIYPPELPPRRSALRREQIISSAAGLFSRNGYAAVGMNDIGAASGVTGPAIYRHFESKAALLAAVIDRVIDSVIVLERPDEGGPAVQQLDASIARYAAAVARQRSVMAVFVREVHHLPAAQQDSLRRRQRELVRNWRTLLGASRTDWNSEQVRTAVHAAFGLLNSVGLFSSPLPDGELARQLARLTRAALGLPQT